MNIKYVLCFLGGLGLGGVGGYFVTKKVDGRKAEDLRNNLKVAEHQIREHTAHEQELNHYIDGLEEQLKKWTRSTEDMVTDMNLDYDTASEEPEDPVPFTEEAEAEAPEEEEYGEMDIYAIGIADFMQDAKYEKKYLTYYRENECYVDSNSEQEIDDPRKILGDMVDLCTVYQGNVMYVRNTKTYIDYQIDFTDGGFYGGE